MMSLFSNIRFIRLFDDVPFNPTTVISNREVLVPRPGTRYVLVPGTKSWYTRSFPPHPIAGWCGCTRLKSKQQSRCSRKTSLCRGRFNCNL